MPVASVRAKQRIERGELKPSHVQLARVLRRRIEAADVRAPERQTGKSGVDADAVGAVAGVLERDLVAGGRARGDRLVAGHRRDRRHEDLIDRRGPCVGARVRPIVVGAAGEGRDGNGNLMKSLKDKFNLKDALPDKDKLARGLAGMSAGAAADGITGAHGPSIWEKVSRQYQKKKPELLAPR